MASRKSNKAPTKKAAPARSAAKRPASRGSDKRKAIPKSATAKKADKAAPQRARAGRPSKASEAAGRGTGPRAAKRQHDAALPSSKTAKGRSSNPKLAEAEAVDLEIETGDVAELQGDPGGSLPDSQEEGVAELDESPDAETPENIASEDADADEADFEYEANEAGEESLLATPPESFSEAPADQQAESDADSGSESNEESPVSEPPNSENRLRISEESNEESADGEGSSDEPVMVIAEDILDGEAEQADTGTLLRSAIEALIFVAEKPVSIKDLAKGLQLDKKRTQELLDELRAEYANRGIRIEEIADGYAFRTHPKIAEYARAFLEQRPVKLSRAQLETLAIVAYRQPITRPEVDEIRGVDCGPVLKGLLERELVRILGKKDEPGRPMLYGTAPAFLDLFGLKSLQELPTLREFAELSEDSRRKYQDTIGEDAPPGLADLGLEAEDEASAPATGVPEAAASDLTLDGLLEAAEASEFTDSDSDLGERQNAEEQTQEATAETNEMDDEEPQAASEDDEDADEDDEDADEDDEDADEDDEDADEDDEDADEDDEDADEDGEDADEDEDDEDEDDEDADEDDADEDDADADEDDEDADEDGEDADEDDEDADEDDEDEDDEDADEDDADAGEKQKE